jgi:hypothetical protein
VFRLLLASVIAILGLAATPVTPTLAGETITYSRCDGGTGSVQLVHPATGESRLYHAGVLVAKPLYLAPGPPCTAINSFSFAPAGSRGWTPANSATSISCDASVNSIKIRHRFIAINYAHWEVYTEGGAYLFTDVKGDAVPPYGASDQVNASFVRCHG